MPQGPLIFKPKSIIPNRIASVGYVEKGMKRSITLKSEYYTPAQNDYKTLHDWVRKKIQ